MNGTRQWAQTNAWLILRAAFIVTAVAMLAITAVPAATWQKPSHEQVYRGFDPKLLSINELNYGARNAGHIDVNRDSIEIDTATDSIPAVHLVGTYAQTFEVQLDLEVQANPGGTVPLRIGIWSARSGSGSFLVFGPAPDNEIYAESVTGGIPLQTLSGGTITREPLGRYSTGQFYRLVVTADKKAGLLTFELTGPGLSTPIQATATRSAPADLLTELNLTLTASATANASSAGGSSATLRDYTLSFPSVAGGPTKVDDPRAKVLVLILAALGAALLLMACGAWTLRHRRRSPRPPRQPARRRLVAAFAAIAAVVVANVLLFGAGTATFDMADQETWSYLAAVYGPVQIYVLAPFVSVARAWNGVPYGAALFPYEPVLGYLFTLMGWISHLFGSFRIDDLAKAFNVAFGLGDGYLIFSILQRLRATWRASATAAALFVFNPAVWFSMSIWGANHVVSIFFLLLAILLAEREQPVGAWVALGIASMTRPQMLVLGVLLAVWFLRRFPVSQNAYAISVTVVVLFLLMVPFTLATAPSLPVDILASTVQVQELGGNEKALTTVSLDAYSFWPLIDFFQAHASGLNRILFPSDTPIAGSVTYQQAGLLTAVLALLASIGMLLFRARRNLEDGGYIPIVLFGFGGFLMFATGLAATHFVLALPLILLSRPWFKPITYYAVVAGWSLTTLTAMYGILAITLANASWLHEAMFGASAPLNGLSVSVGNLYTWDRAITTGVVINVMCFIAFALAAVRGRRSAE